MQGGEQGVTHSWAPRERAAPTARGTALTVNDAVLLRAEPLSTAKTAFGWRLLSMERFLLYFSRPKGKRMSLAWECQLYPSCSILRAGARAAWGWCPVE